MAVQFFNYTRIPVEDWDAEELPEWMEDDLAYVVARAYYDYMGTMDGLAGNVIGIYGGTSEQDAISNYLYQSYDDVGVLDAMDKVDSVVTQYIDWDAMARDVIYNGEMRAALVFWDYEIAEGPHQSYVLFYTW